MNKIKTVKIKEEDGSISEESYTIAADAVNIDMKNGKDLQETVGNIDIDNDGNIETQLKNKINKNNIVDNLDSTDFNKVLSANQGKILGDKLNKKPYYYNTIADMKADTKLKAGDMAITLGYYEANDGGGAEYIITNKENNNQIKTENNLFIELVINNDTINFKQLGAKPNDNTFDNYQYFKLYESFCKNLNKTIKLIIPNGTWYTSPVYINRLGGFIIEGIGSKQARTFATSVISAISDQDYILKIGGVADMNNDIIIPYNNSTTNCNLSNLTFSSDYKLNYGGLVLEYCNYSFFRNIFFTNLIGTGLYIHSSWENYFDGLMFRQIYDFSKPALCFGFARPISGVSANISSSNFNNLMFENVAGDFIFFENRCEFTNNQFGIINIENSRAFLPTDSSHAFSDDINLDDMIPQFVFNGNVFDVTIDAINYTGDIAFASWYQDANNNKYYFKGLFKANTNLESKNSDRFCVSVNNVILKTWLVILQAYRPYGDGFLFNISSLIIDTSAQRNNYIKYLVDVINVKNININYLRRQNFAFYPNTEDLYKHQSGAFVVSTEGTNNPFGLALLKPSSGSAYLIDYQLRYPFNYSETYKKIFTFKIKPTSDSYSFMLRGTHNGNNIEHTYSQQNVEPDKWINVEVEMNFDFNSQISILYSNCYFDTITYVGEREL